MAESKRSEEKVLAFRNTIWYACFTKRRRVPGAFRAGRENRETGAKPVRDRRRKEAAPAKDVTASMMREGWPERGVLSTPTF